MRRRARGGAQRSCSSAGTPTREPRGRRWSSFPGEELAVGGSGARRPSRVCRHRPPRARSTTTRPTRPSAAPRSHATSGMRHDVCRRAGFRSRCFVADSTAWGVGRGAWGVERGAGGMERGSGGARRGERGAGSRGAGARGSSERGAVARGAGGLCGAGGAKAGGARPGACGGHGVRRGGRSWIRRWAADPDGFRGCVRIR